MIDRLLRLLNRKRRSVVFNDLSAVNPVSRLFGLERGTAIDRYYIERFLASRRHLIRGRVLEVGGDEYSRRFGGDRVEAYEVLHATPGNRAATLVADLTAVDALPGSFVDCFICTQTFNFIFDVGKAVAGAHHLLKPGGALLATVSGISQISRFDMERWGDYWRFTTASVDRLFRPLFGDGIEVRSFGNVLAASAFLQGLAVEDLPDPALLDERDPDYQVVISVVAERPR